MAFMLATALFQFACFVVLVQGQSAKQEECTGKTAGSQCEWTISGGSKVGQVGQGTCQNGSCTVGSGSSSGESSGTNGVTGEGSGEKAGRLTDAELAAFKWVRKGMQTNKLNEPLGLDGKVSIELSSDLKSLVIKSNGIPEHDAGYDLTPNSMQAMDYTYTVPIDPELTSSDADDSAGCLPYSPIGLTLAGVPIFSAFTAAFKTDTGEVVTDTCCDPVAEEVDLVDECLGHGSPYHYHALTKCNIADFKCGSPGSILGIMFDGIGIYTPADTDGAPIPASKLDRCGGMTGKDGRYRYHITKNFPHTIGCFRGAARAPEMLSTCACAAQQNKAHATCPWTPSAETKSACTLCSNTKCITDKQSNTCDATCQECKSTGACAEYCGAGATIKTITPWKVANISVTKSNEDALYCSVVPETYVLLTSGRCPVNQQVSKDECLAAAKSVGASAAKTQLDGGVDSGLNGRPHGCTLHGWGNVEWWGTSDDAPCGNLNYDCVCKKGSTRRLMHNVYRGQPDTTAILV